MGCNLFFINLILLYINKLNIIIIDIIINIIINTIINIIIFKVP